MLEIGTDYDRLPELMVIFILSYDPFGANDMIYEARSFIKTHPEIEYIDGIRRIFLYVDGNLPDNAGENERKSKALLAYIGNSVGKNVTDEATKKLDDIVKSIKKKPEVGIRYMKSWEHDRKIREQAIKEHKAEVDTERMRADIAEAKASEAEAKASEAEAELAKYRAKFGEID